MIDRLLRNVPGGPVARIYRFLRNPVETQQRVLRQLLSKASRTEWGRRFSFDALARDADVLAAYRDAVPAHGYEDVREDIARIRQRVPDVMWPGTITDFAVSSGTASAGKIIPVSRETLLANKRFSMGIMYNYIARTGNLKFLGGKFLSLPGRIDQDPEHPGTYIGEVSGLQARYAPAVVQKFAQAVPNETLFIPNWEDKLDAIVRQTVAMDVRSAVMTPTWALILFEQLLERYTKVTGLRAETVRDVWPNFRVCFSGGVALSSYRGLLEEQVGLGEVDFLEAYGASEGFFAFQLDRADRDMVLHLDNGVYYEFLPLGADEGCPRKTLAEVQLGVRYQMFVSTASGLWAYGVGDVVRFTSLQPFRIVVAGRTSEMIDNYGEAVFGDEARAALAEACSDFAATIVDYHVAPLPPARDRLPTHEWFIEFETPPENLDAFAAALDDFLQQVNRHYKIRREGRAFAIPRVVSVPRGTFYRWLADSRASVSAQSKVPRMSDERKVANKLRELIGTASA